MTGQPRIWSTHANPRGYAAKPGTPRLCQAWKGRIAIAASRHCGSLRLLNHAWPQILDGRKFQRRRSRGLWRQNRARVHQKATSAFVLLVLRLAGWTRDNISIPVDEKHPHARADGHLAAILRKG